MATPIRANYDQLFLLPPMLEDWLPADHAARFVREFVTALDLPALGFRAVFATNGRSAYAPELLLSLWLYGYLEKLRSSRRIDSATYNHLGMMWLAGLHHPDFRTLNTFRTQYRVEVYRCAACRQCPDRALCTTSKTGRTVECTEHDDAFQRQRQKQRLPDNRFLLKQRGSIIERLFGEVKQVEGFRRFTVAGLEAVKAQWAMMCLTINLKRFY